MLQRKERERDRERERERETGREKVLNFELDDKKLRPPSMLL